MAHAVPIVGISKITGVTQYIIPNTEYKYYIEFLRGNLENDCYCLTALVDNLRQCPGPEKYLYLKFDVQNTGLIENIDIYSKIISSGFNNVPKENILYSTILIDNIGFCSDVTTTAGTGNLNSLNLVDNSIETFNPINKSNYFKQILTNTDGKYLEGSVTDTTGFTNQKCIPYISVIDKTTKKYVVFYKDSMLGSGILPNSIDVYDNDELVYSIKNKFYIYQSFKHLTDHINYSLGYTGGICSYTSDNNTIFILPNSDTTAYQLILNYSSNNKLTFVGEISDTYHRELCEVTVLENNNSTVLTNIKTGDLFYVGEDFNVNLTPIDTHKLINAKVYSPKYESSDPFVNLVKSYDLSTINTITVKPPSKKCDIFINSEHIKYLLKIFTDSNTYTSKTGNVEVLRRSSVPIEFRPINPDVYEIESLAINGVNVNHSLFNGTYTFQDIVSDNTIEVKSKLIFYTVNISHDIQLELVNCTLSNPIQRHYNFDLEFKIKDPDKYEIDNVIINNTAIDKSLITEISPGTYRYTITDAITNYNVVIRSKLIRYTMISSAGQFATIAPLGTTSILRRGTMQYNFNTVNNDKYEIDQLVVDGNVIDHSSLNGQYIFSNIIANHTINATAKLIMYTINASVDSQSFINNSGANKYLRHSNVEFLFGPNDPDRYFISNVTVDGNQLDVNSLNHKYEFIDLISDHSIQIESQHIFYNIEYSVDEHAIITGPTKVDKYSDAVISFSVNDDRYKIFKIVIDGIEYDGETIGNEYTFNSVIQNHTVSATTQLIKHYINANSDEFITLVPSGNVEVTKRDNKKFTFNVNNPNLRILKSINVDGVNHNPNNLENDEYTFSDITSNHSLYVLSEELKYNITYNGDENTTINPIGTVRYNKFDNAVLTFSPTNPDLYYISSILDTYNNTQLYGEAITALNGTYNINNILENRTIAVNSTKYKYLISSYYDTEVLNVSPDFILVDKRSDNQITYSIKPEFAQLVEIDSIFIDGIAQNLNELNGTININNITKEMLIEFRLKYTVETQTDTNGTISPLGINKYLQGTNFDITLTPNEGYRVNTFTINGNDNKSNLVNNVYSYLNSDFIGNKVIAVTYELIPYNVTVNVGENGTSTFSGINTIQHGNNLQLTITPNENYQIDKLMVDTIDRTSEIVNNVFSINNIVSDHIVEITFKPA